MVIFHSYVSLPEGNPNPKLVKILLISSTSRDLLIGLVWGGEGMVWQSFRRGHDLRKRVNFEDMLDVHALQYQYQDTKLNLQVGFAVSSSQYFCWQVLKVLQCFLGWSFIQIFGWCVIHIFHVLPLAGVRTAAAEIPDDVIEIRNAWGCRLRGKFYVLRTKKCQAFVFHTQY